MKIVTAVVNNPNFIELQYNSLKKHVKNNYEFIVFNDAKPFSDFTNGNDVTIRQQIIDICKKLNINCINIKNQHHKTMKDAANRCSDSMNFILKYQIKNPNRYLIIDSDMFLINDFDSNKFNNYHCAVVLQSRNKNKIHYFWNGICYLDFKKIKDTNLLNWNLKPHCDVGGMMEEWFRINMDEDIPNRYELRYGDDDFNTKKIYFIKHLWSTTWNLSELPSNIKNAELIDFLKTDPRNSNGKFFSEIYDNCFLHYRAGGNWREEGMDFHEQLTEKLARCLV